MTILTYSDHCLSTHSLQAFLKASSLSKILFFNSLSSKITLTGALLFLLSSVSAQATKVIGTSGDWTAYHYQEKKQNVCYIAAQPTKAEGSYQKRGDIQFMVSIRPAEKVKGEISYAAGYSYHPNKPAFVKIDAKQFPLIPHQDRAWLESTKADAEVMQAMKKGSVMVVTGSSARGTQTTDTYSLKGFTKSYEMARAACGAK
jgi:invasion protein IalB